MPVAPDLCGSALDGRYELHAMIGEGAFGRVYRGLDRRLGRTVAVKVIKPWWAEDPEWVALFEREARMLARVSDPGIVQIYDVGHAEEGLYYVSELVAGESLQERLRRGPLRPWEAAALAEQLCRGLAHAHTARIVHRDVKPANVLISSEGRVKIGDFGVARLAEGTSDGALGTVVGTPRYMAPEQGRGRAISPATDVYSVGIVLYEMLTGAPPFTGTTAVELAVAHLQDPPPPLPASVPGPLVDVVMRALAKDPAARYGEGGQLGDALAAARAGARSAPAQRSARSAPGRAAADHTLPAPPRSRRRNWNPAARRRSIALLGLVLAVIAAMLVLASALGGTARTRVPGLRGLTRGHALARLRGARLNAALSARYDPRAPVGRVIAQSPPAGRRLAEHSRVRLTVSRGPAPVPLPDLRQENVADAQLTLSRAGLRPRVLTGPDPGRAPGTVYAQRPAGGARRVPAHSTVTLYVAETPRWRTVTSLSGSGAASSVPFRIRGSRWRVSYAMHYQGVCTFIFFCDGPSARVVASPGDRTLGGFGIQDGGGHTNVFDTGPGTFQLKLTPGRDDARYTIAIQDFY